MESSRTERTVEELEAENARLRAQLQETKAQLQDAKVTIRYLKTSQSSRATSGSQNNGRSFPSFSFGGSADAPSSSFGSASGTFNNSQPFKFNFGAADAPSSSFGSAQGTFNSSQQFAFNFGAADAPSSSFGASSKASSVSVPSASFGSQAPLFGFDPVETPSQSVEPSWFNSNEFSQHSSNFDVGDAPSSSFGNISAISNVSSSLGVQFSELAVTERKKENRTLENKLKPFTAHAKNLAGKIITSFDVTRMDTGYSLKCKILDKIATNEADKDPECIALFVRNKEIKDEHFASRTGLVETKELKVVIHKVGWGFELMAKQANCWECSNCWLLNDINKSPSRCKACGDPRKGVSSSTVTSSANT